MNTKLRRMQPPKIPAVKLSDKSRLLWERYFPMMNGAAQAMNAAIQNTENVLAGIILEIEGVSIETHQVNFQTMEIVPRPRQPGNNNGKMGE
jgi:hypothetical protein